jgi:hypothetical protein
MFIFLTQLIKMKPKSSLQVADALISRFINYAVQSGTVTAVCAGVDLTLFLKFRSNNLHDVAYASNYLKDLSL